MARRTEDEPVSQELTPCPNSSVGKESACNAGDPTLIPESGRSAGEGIGYPPQYSWASPEAQLVKNRLQCRRPRFDPWIGTIPWRRERLPTPVFWPGEFHGVTKSWTRLGNFHFQTHAVDRPLWPRTVWGQERDGEGPLPGQRGKRDWQAPMWCIFTKDMQGCSRRDCD